MEASLVALVFGGIGGANRAASAAARRNGIPLFCRRLFLRAGQPPHLPTKMRLRHHAPARLAIHSRSFKWREDDYDEQRILMKDPDQQQEQRRTMRLLSTEDDDAKEKRTPKKNRATP